MMKIPAALPSRGGSTVLHARPSKPGKEEGRALSQLSDVLAIQPARTANAGPLQRSWGQFVEKPKKIG